MSSSRRCCFGILIALLTKVSSICGDASTSALHPNGRVKTPTFAGEYPFVGSLELVSSDSAQLLCVVTAITEKWVLTVHSCFSILLHDNELNLTVSLLKDAGGKVKIPNFHLGKTDIGEKTIDVDSILLGPQLGEDRLVLMRLTTPISKQLISKVQLGTKVTQPHATCINVGWSPVLYPGAEVLMSDPELQHVSQNVSVSPANTTVTAEIKGHVVWGKTPQTDPSHDICKFERGSPLLCQDGGSTWNLMGVAGNVGDPESDMECSSPEAYAQYILITPYVKWILSQIRKTDNPKEAS
ncbi:uncharacterized protein LOC135469154 [Liolophura sinensis]|uniref:uncharacterized protein LOC135469154 n=1 Tax=Liolophura sinensis TaxID=3198878 RepID=UPI0031590221